MPLDKPYAQNKTLLIVSACGLLLMGFLVSISLPNFIEVFDSFGTELPIFSQWVLQSYQYWWLLACVPLALFIGDFYHPLSGSFTYQRNSKIIAILGMWLAMALFIAAFLAIYLPTFSVTTV